MNFNLKLFILNFEQELPNLVKIGFYLHCVQRKHTSRFEFINKFKQLTGVTCKAREKR